MKRHYVLGGMLALVGMPSLAQVTAEQLAAAEIRTEKVGDDLYVLFGLGGNIAVSVGTQGVLAVDTQFPELVPRYLAAIRELGGRSVDFAINTHWHYDHADGNLVLGPTGTWIVAHANSRAMLLHDNVINTVVRPPFPQKAYPTPALPVAPGATVIPGHGAVAKYEDLVAYIAMLKGVRAKLADLIRSGATLEQAIAARPTAEWDARYGDPTRMVNRGYAALSRR